MKKAAVLSIAAFYLLLTTGMFVCLVHCTGQSLWGNKIAMQAMHHSSHHHKHGTESDGCDCCKNHSNYVIKENIKPVNVDEQQPLLAIVLKPAHCIPLNVHEVVSNIARLNYGKDPPGLSGKMRAIQQRSLQI